MHDKIFNTVLESWPWVAAFYVIDPPKPSTIYLLIADFFFFFF